MSGVVKRLFGVFKKKEDGDAPDRLGQIGIKILADEKMEYRLAVVNEISEEINKVKQEGLKGKGPREILEWYLDRSNSIAYKINQACIPWGRAGDDRRYAGVVSGWSTLHVRTVILLEGMVGYIDHLERGDQLASVQKTEAEMHEIVIKARYFFMDVFIKYAERIMGYSWFSQDVTGKWIATVQMPFMAPAPGQAIPQGYPPSFALPPPGQANNRGEA